MPSGPPTWLRHDLRARKCLRQRREFADLRMIQPRIEASGSAAPAGEPLAERLVASSPGGGA